jgi:hypothetical protein
MAIAAGGACHHVKTNPLLSVDEGMMATKRAGGSGYKPVTGKNRKTPAMVTIEWHLGP